MFLVVAVLLTIIDGLRMDGSMTADYFLYNEPLSDYTEINKTSWVAALSTMSYHRDMMNEYLCRNYVATEIFEAMQNKTVMDKRMGSPSKSVRSIRETLLGDPGSVQYKDWLSRSSTLEDIYRHYENAAAAEDAPVPQTVPAGDGEVTGYAMVGNKVASGHTGYGASTSYGVPEYGTHEEYEEHDEKGMKLKELFQLALTAIAFLAFSMFIIEVIMCIMGVESTQPVMFVQPVAGATFKEESQIDPPTNRQQRASPVIDIPIDVLNAMSSKVLSSIEAFALLHEDNGQCLRRTLCEANKYSRTLTGIERIWLPLWSFGASWVAGRLQKSKTSTSSFALMEYLKSSIFGLGNADCRAHYKDCKPGLRNKRQRIR